MPQQPSRTSRRVSSRRAAPGGPHELGQNFLHHRPTIDFIVDLVAATDGGILELGAGDGALTRRLVALNRDLTAVELDGNRAARLREQVPGARIVHGDAMSHPLDRPTVVGNIPFHLTTPILRRLLTASGWRQSVLLTQWEVARKRAGVGGGTMMTAQAAPWYVFRLHRRVDSGHFRPRPSVDGGILSIQRRDEPLVPVRQRRAYAAFVRAVFTGRGGTLARIIARSWGVPARAVDRALAAAGVKRGDLPRDLTGEQWSALWVALPVR